MHTDTDRHKHKVKKGRDTQQKLMKKWMLQTVDKVRDKTTGKICMNN